MRRRRWRAKQLSLRDKAPHLTRFQALEGKYRQFVMFFANRLLFSFSPVICRGRRQTLRDTCPLKLPENRGEMAPCWQVHWRLHSCGPVSRTSLEVIDRPQLLTLSGSKSESRVHHLRV